MLLSAILTAAIVAVLAKDFVVKHYKVCLGTGLILLGNLLSLKFIFARGSSTDGVRKDSSVDDSGIVGDGSVGYSNTSGGSAVQFLLAEICIAAVLWYLFDTRETRDYFIPTALAGAAPVLVLYGVYYIVYYVVYFLWFYAKVAFFQLSLWAGCCIMLFFQVDLCMSWIGLVVFRFIAILSGSNSEGWLVVLQRGICESSETLAGGLGLSAVFGYLVAGVSMLLFFAVGRLAGAVEGQSSSNPAQNAAILINMILWNRIIGMPFNEHLPSKLHMFIMMLSITTRNYTGLIQSSTVKFAASQSRNVMHHVRVLLFSLFFLLLPVYVTYQMTSSYGSSAWVYTVVHVLVMNAIQMTGCLASYIILVVDNFTSHNLWENVDSPLLVSTCVTFIIHIMALLFCIGCALWVVFYEFEWQIVAVIIVSLCDIFIRIGVCIVLYAARMEILAKLETLPNATAQQLLAYDNVCAICLEPMDIARITPCGHIFHANCLFKSLNIRPTCPWCNQDIAVGVRPAQSNVIGLPFQRNNMNRANEIHQGDARGFRFVQNTNGGVRFRQVNVREVPLIRNDVFEIPEQQQNVIGDRQFYQENADGGAPFFHANVRGVPAYENNFGRMPFHQPNIGGVPFDQGNGRGIPFNQNNFNWPRVPIQQEHVDGGPFFENNAGGARFTY